MYTAGYRHLLMSRFGHKSSIFIQRMILACCISVNHVYELHTRYLKLDYILVNSFTCTLSTSPTCKLFTIILLPKR